MTPLGCVLLGLIFTFYLLFGGSVFMTLEQKNEINRNTELVVLRKDIQEILFQMDRQFYVEGIPLETLENIRQSKERVLTRISEACGGTNLFDTNSTTPDTLRWTFYNSVFFAFTAITTIGYGNLAPDTHWSRIFTIFYALIGIPINGIILSKISTFYNRKLAKVLNRVKATESRVTFTFNVIFFLIPGLLLFIIVPAVLFVIIEKWGYLDAIYFCFVTLTTIGFGDYVAGMGDGHNIWRWIYKVAIIVWIVFGLGYLVMVLNFITKGITSKKVRTVFEKKVNRLRVTRAKLINDVDFMRKVLNEMKTNLSKENSGFLTSTAVASDESIETYIPDTHQEVPNLRRSKSFDIPRDSFPDVIDITLIKSFSESDLDRFNKSTVGSVPDVQQMVGGDFLNQLVTYIEDDITEVLEAVQDLEAFDYENPNTNNEISVTVEKYEQIEKPLEWTLGMGNADKEILLHGSNEGSPLTTLLEEVVIHVPESSRRSVGGSILDKVTDVLRKISSGNLKPSSDPPSRNLSRNDPENMIGNTQTPNVFKISNQSSTVGGTTINSIPNANGHPFYICEKDNTFNVVPFSLPRNSSQTSCEYGSDDSNKIGESEKPRSRKVSKAGKSSLPRNVSLDSNILNDFLKILDDVEEQLDEECLPSANTMGGCKNGFTVSKELPPQEVPHPHGSDMRNRKLGMFNPDFNYFNPDLTGRPSGKLRDIESNRINRN